MKILQIFLQYLIIFELEFDFLYFFKDLDLHLVK